MPDEFQTLKKERCIEIIKACNGSGMPKRQWCREHGISYSTFMRWQRSLRNELAGKIMVTQAVDPLQIEPQASRCTPAQEVTIQKDGISISMHGVSSDMVIAIVRGLSSCYWRPAEIAPVVFLANANMAAITLEKITFLKAAFQVNRKS